MNATITGSGVPHLAAGRVGPGISIACGETPDGAVVISGDTIVGDEVAELTVGADLLVHEAFRRAAARRLPG